jgi:hypothetical protein
VKRSSQNQSLPEAPSPGSGRSGQNKSLPKAVHLEVKRFNANKSHDVVVVDGDVHAPNRRKLNDKN